jgi:hypothetical protein
MRNRWEMQEGGRQTVARFYEAHEGSKTLLRRLGHDVSNMADAVHRAFHERIFVVVRIVLA